MARARHTDKTPDKTIEAALAQLEEIGWPVETAKGRRAHARGFIRCPEHAQDKCRNGVLCQAQVRSTPRNPTGHARDLLRKARAWFAAAPGPSA